MEFSYTPINPFQDDGLSKEDRAMIDGMRNTAYICGYSGEDVENIVHKSLKRMGRYDLLPPCEQVDKHTVRMAIEALEQQPKTGHWIKMSEGFTLYECSECEAVEFKKSKYCPNCGVKMEDSEK